MKYSPLKKSGLTLSKIGLGTWAFSGEKGAYHWGPQDSSVAKQIILRSLENGINWIDTAPSYGLGNSEQIIGEALRDWSEEVIISSKCGLIPDRDNSLKPSLLKESIFKEVEQSLLRLGVDTIHLYQIHWPRDTSHLDEAWESLLLLKDQGKILCPGVSNYSTKQLNKNTSKKQLSFLQSPLSLISQDTLNSQLPWCRKENIGFLAYSPLQNGLLSGFASNEWRSRIHETDWRKLKSNWFQDPIFQHVINYTHSLKLIAQELGLSLSEFALNWAIQQKGVTAAIVGCRSLQQLDAHLSYKSVTFATNTIREVEEKFRNFKAELHTSKIELKKVQESSKVCNSQSLA